MTALRKNTYTRYIQRVNKLLMEKQIADIFKILKDRTNVHNPYRDIIYLMYILKTLEL